MTLHMSLAELFRDIAGRIRTKLGGTQKGTASTTLTTESSTITFNVASEPTFWYCQLASNENLNSNGHVVYVYYWYDMDEGPFTEGGELDNTSIPFKRSGNYSWTYANGILTIQCTTHNFYAGTYDLIYTYGSYPVMDFASPYIYSDTTSISFQLSNKPKNFVICARTQMSFSPSSSQNRVISIIYDSNVSESIAKGVSYGDSAYIYDNFNVSYSGTTLTISSNGASAPNGGYFSQSTLFRFMSIETSDYSMTADDFPDAIDDVYEVGIENGAAAAKVGTASAADVRINKTFTNYSTIGEIGTIPDATTGTSSSGTLVATKSLSTSDQYVNITAGYTPARYWKISAISTTAGSSYNPTTYIQTVPVSGQYLTGNITFNAIQTATASVTANTAVQTISPSSGQYLTSVTINPQIHSSTYNANKITANTRIDLNNQHNYRYINFYGYDYDIINMNNGGSNTVRFTAPWGTNNYTYAYWKVPAKFYCRCFMFHSMNGRMHGYLDFSNASAHTRVDDTTFDFTMQNMATGQTTYNTTNYGWYRGTYNGSQLYPNSTIYVCSNVSGSTQSIKGIYGGYYVA